MTALDPPPTEPTRDVRTADDLWRWLTSCLDCHEPHKWQSRCAHEHAPGHRCSLSGSWASPVDGHAYRRRAPLAQHLRDQWDAEA